MYIQYDVNVIESAFWRRPEVSIGAGYVTRLVAAHLELAVLSGDVIQIKQLDWLLGQLEESKAISNYV